jgi:uncharacterized membrane protein
MTRSEVYWAIALGLVAATFAASAYLSPSMPDQIPTHWNIHGQVDGYGTKSLGMFLMPGIAVVMLGFFAILPWLSPKNFEVDTFHDTYLFVMVTTIGLFAYLHAVILFATWAQVAGAARWFDIGRALVGGIFLFLALLGNVMGKVRRNFYIGIKVPWTLASDRVWNDTHRLAAWTMVGGSLIGFLVVVSGLSLVIAFAVLIVSFLIPLVYSFVHYKQLERRGAL